MSYLSLHFWLEALMSCYDSLLTRGNQINRITTIGNQVSCVSLSLVLLSLSNTASALDVNGARALSNDLFLDPKMAPSYGADMAPSGREHQAIARNMLYLLKGSNNGNELLPPRRETPKIPKPVDQGQVIKRVRAKLKLQRVKLKKKRAQMKKDCKLRNEAQCKNRMAMFQKDTRHIRSELKRLKTLLRTLKGSTTTHSEPNSVLEIIDASKGNGKSARDKKKTDPKSSN